MIVMLLQNNVYVYKNNNNNLPKGGLPTTIQEEYNNQNFNKNDYATTENNRSRLNVFSLPHTGWYTINMLYTIFYVNIKLFNKFFFLKNRWPKT